MIMNCTDFCGEINLNLIFKLLVGVELCEHSTILWSELLDPVSANTTQVLVLLCGCSCCWHGHINQNTTLLSHFTRAFRTRPFHRTRTEVRNSDSGSVSVSVSDLRNRDFPKVAVVRESHKLFFESEGKI
jgi:hypothetical protein